MKVCRSFTHGLLSGQGRQKVVDRVPGLLALSADPLFLVVVDAVGEDLQRIRCPDELSGLLQPFETGRDQAVLPPGPGSAGGVVGFP